MDKKTRVLNCIDGKPIDKVPFTFWHHYFNEEAHGKACVAAHKKIYDEGGFDFIKMMSDGFFPIDFGTKIEKPADWDKINIPKMTDAYVLDQVDRLKWMREAVNDECLIYYIMFSGYQFMRRTYGDDITNAHIKDPANREIMTRTMNNMGDFVAEMCAVLMKDGKADGIHMSIAGGFNFTKEEYDELLKPQDWKVMNTCNAINDYNIVHLCGYAGVQNDLSWYRDYTGAIMHWDQHTDKMFIPEAKAYFPNKRAIMAGFDNKPDTLLYTCSEKEVKDIAKEYVRSGGETGFILSADCSLDPSVDYKRLRWVGEALEELATGK